MIGRAASAADWGVLLLLWSAVIAVLCAIERMLSWLERRDERRRR